MSRALQSSLKALTTAANDLKDDNARAVLKDITHLLKQVKLGDALSTEHARSLVNLFDEEMEVLYSRLPQATINFSTSYLAELLRHFKSQQPHSLWQHVAGKGVLNGLVACLQGEDTGDVTHFEKTFITALCQLLTSTPSRKHPRLTTDLRRSIGAFLAAVTVKHQQVKKWMLESKVLGITGLSDLIIAETEFRVLDTCLEIATRLAPKRADPQARRAFFTDVLGSASAKAKFGGDACKNLMRLVDRPLKGCWFQISDELFAEMSGNANSLQRFVIELLVVSGKTYSAEMASLRLFLDTEITFNAYIIEEGEEILITTSYDNLSEVQIDSTKGSASAKMVLRTPPTWHNHSELSSQASPLSVTIRISTDDMTRFQEVLKRRGQAAKVYDRSKPTKQSFASHPLELYQVEPSTPPALQEKAEIMKSLVPSPTSVEGTQPSQDASKSVQDRTRSDSEKPEVTKPERPEAKSKSPVSRQTHASDLPGITVRRGVIVDESDDDLPDEKTSSKSKAIQALKRKSSELTDVDDVESPPAHKRIRVEGKNAKEKSILVKKGLPDASSTARSNKPPQHNDSRGLDIVPKSTKTASPLIHSRINARIHGMKDMDGTRPAASAPSRRPRRAAKGDIPRSVQEPPQEPMAAVEPIRAMKRSKAEPERAIWEAEDFSQRAAFIFSAKADVPKGKVGYGDAIDINDGGAENQNVEQEMFNTFIVNDYGDDYGAEENAEDPEDDEEYTYEPEEVEIQHIGYNAESRDDGEDADAQHDAEEPARDSNSKNSTLKKKAAENEIEPMARTEDAMIVDDIPVTPSPAKIAHRFDNAMQDEGPSSPIRPIMVLKRKLRDADALSQRMKVQVAKSARTSVPSDKSGENATFDEEDTSFPPIQSPALLRSLPKQARPYKTVARGIEMQPPRSFLRPNNSQKKQLVVNWAVPIDPSCPRPTVAKENANKLGAEKPSKDVRGLKQTTRDADKKKAPKYKPQPRSEVTDEDSESEVEQKKEPTPSKSEMGAIADVLNAIQDTILGNIQKKVSGLRREARMARANLLETAVLDLDVMQGDHERSFGRFMRLEEKCGEVSQSVIGALGEVHMANQAVLVSLDAIVQQHDETTAATKAARKPLFPKKLPAYLMV